MFDNLLALVKENAGDAIVKNPAIPNEKNDEAISQTTNSIMDTLKAQMANGKLDDVMSMFKGGNVDAAHPTVNAVSNNAVSDLMAKFGLDKGAASGIVSSLIPTVLGKLVNKTNDPKDSSFDLQGILGSLGGGGNILGGLSNMFK